MADKSIEIFKKILSDNLLTATPIDLPEQTQPSKRAGFAQYFLSGNNELGKRLTEREGAQTEPVGLLTKAFDVLSGPLYGAYDFVQEQAENVVDLAQGDLGKIDDIAFQSAESFGRGLLRSADSASDIPGVANISDLIPDEVAKREAAERTLGSDILGDMGIDNKWAKYGGGFALDVAADPLTYVPGINILGMIRKARAAKQGIDEAAEVVTEKAAASTPINNPTPFVKPSAKIVDEPQTRVPGLGESFEVPKVNVPVANEPLRPNVDPEFSWGSGDTALRILGDQESLKSMAQARRSDNAWRAAQARWGRNPDIEDAFRNKTPESPGEFVERMRDAKLRKQGKVLDGRGNLSYRALDDVMRQMENGELMQFTRTPEAATGETATRARELADDFLTKNLMPNTGKKRIDLNPANQANLYNRMFAATEDLAKAHGFKKVGAPKAMKWRRAQARKMLRSAEDHMIRLGKQPVFWNGMRVRLSDVLEEVGVEANDELATRVLDAFVRRDVSRIKETPVAEAIQKALAGRALANADLAMNVKQYAEQAKKNILAGYSAPKAHSIIQAMPEAAAESLRRMGLTEEEAKKVKDLVRNVIDVDKIPYERLIDELGPALNKAAVEGRMDPSDYRKIIRKMAESIGTTPEKLANDVSGYRVLDSFMNSMTTWYGRGELKSLQHGTFIAAQRNAESRATWLRNIVKGHTQEEIISAFRYVQYPAMREASEDAKIIALSDKFKDYFDTMLGSSGFDKLTDSFGTVATRSALFMEDVNKILRQRGTTFQFRNDKKAKNIFGEPRDYSKDGVGWMRYWENADPLKSGQDPVSFMYDIDVALELATKRAWLLDEFAMRFGATKADKHFNKSIHTHQIGDHRLEGYHFPKAERDQMIRLLTDIEDNIWMPKNPITRFYSRALRAWKTGVTIYLPSHHIRNMIGDMHLMWWAGHNNPRDFIRARRVLHSQGSKYKDVLQQDTLEGLRGVIDKDAMAWAATRSDDVILNKNGHRLTADEIYIAAFQRGLLLDANRYEDIFGVGPLEGIGKQGSTLNKVISRPLGEKAHKAATSVAQYREHFIRLSHFIAAANKGMAKGGDLKKILDDAAEEVRKWHPDGTDLTNFEQKVRQFIPFYSWTRKALPLIVEAAVQRPSKILYYPRAMHALQGIAGIEAPEGIYDPFPNDQLFPDWILASGIGPIGDPESDDPFTAWWSKLGRNSLGLHGQEDGYVQINPGNPFNDLVEMFGGIHGNPQEIMNGALNSLTPAVKVPFELSTDTKTFSGAPISERAGGEGLLAYLAEQIPMISPAQNIAEIGKEDKAGREGGWDSQAFLNYLTAMRLRGTGYYEKSAEFDALERAKQ